MFLLAELNKISQLLSSSLLGISGSVVDSFSNNETLLLCESVKIFLQVHRISSWFVLAHLGKFVRWGWFCFPNNLFLCELLCLELLFGHGLSNPFDFVKAIV